jgi:hypothetical protein
LTSTQEHQARDLNSICWPDRTRECCNAKCLCQLIPPVVSTETIAFTCRMDETTVLRKHEFDLAHVLRRDNDDIAGGESVWFPRGASHARELAMHAGSTV